MAERILPRPSPAAPPDVVNNYAHWMCKRCNGYPASAPPEAITLPVTSVCRLYKGAIREPEFTNQLPMCRVCDDYASTGRCPQGHDL